MFNVLRPTPHTGLEETTFARTRPFSRPTRISTCKIYNTSRATMLFTSQFNPCCINIFMVFLKCKRESFTLDAFFSNDNFCHQYCQTIFLLKNLLLKIFTQIENWTKKYYQSDSSIYYKIYVIFFIIKYFVKGKINKISDILIFYDWKKKRQQMYHPPSKNRFFSKI